ncbi:hypothetical protein ACP179_08570 [Xenorhabdus stockiae]
MSPVELSSFTEIFLYTGSLELILLEHTFIKTAAGLCDDHWCDRWRLYGKNFRG